MKPLKATNTENSEFKLLFSTSKMSPMVKLAIISVDSNIIPKSLAIITFFLSQLQVLSVLLKTGLISFSNRSLSLSYSFNIIHEAISVGDALDFSGSFGLSVFVLALAYSYLVAGLLLIGYLLKDMYHGKTHSKVIQRIWGTGAYLHILLFFYPVHSISLKAISVSFAQDERQVFGTKQAWTFIQASSCMALIVNLFFALVILIYLIPPVKTRFALSSKTKKLTILDICLKFILPLIWMIDFKSESLNIFLIVINVIFCLLRDGLFYRTLPYYNIMTLRVASKVYAGLTLFSLAIVVAEGLSHAHFYESLLIILTIFVLLAPFVIKTYSACIENIFNHILFAATANTNPYYLAHYWFIYKDLAKKRSELKSDAKKCDKWYLYYTTLLDKIAHKSLKMSRREEDLHWARLILQGKGDFFISANCVLSLGINFLRNSVQRNPHSVLQRLTLASHYIKYQHSYQTANQLIQEGLERSPSFTKSVSFSLILLKIIRKLRLDKASMGSSQAKGINGSVSIEDYLSLHQKFEKIKEDIKDQLEPQIKFWKNFQFANKDLDSFIDLAQLTHQRSKRVFRYIKHYHDFVGMNFVEPILTLGLYLSFVQNETLAGGKMMKEYDRRKTKPKSDHHHKDGVDDHVMSGSSMYFIVSASFHDVGKILNFSNNANQILSLQKETILGKSINLFAPNIYKNGNDHILGVSLKEDIFASLGKPREIPVLDRRGNLLTCKISITLEFLPKEGLSYCILLTPADMTNRVVLIKQNGVIMSFSEKFGEEMGLVRTDKKDNFNIFSLCPQMAVLIRAFQHMSQQKGSSKTIDKTRTQNEEGNSSSVTDSIEKEELKDTMNEKDNDFQRLFDKFTSGENIIFSPAATKKLELNPSIAGLDDKDDLSAMPVVYNAVMKPHNIAGEKVYEIKLQQVINANLAVVWANQDPALKGPGLKTYASYQMVANTLNSMKNKGKSPFSAISAKHIKLMKNASKASIWGLDMQSEEKIEVKKNVLMAKTETTPEINLVTLPNSCDLRESDQELAANEPLIQPGGGYKNGMKKGQIQEEDEDDLDEEMKLKIIKLGIFKKQNKGKLVSVVQQARRETSFFKIADDVLVNFKGITLRKLVNELKNKNNNNQMQMDDSSSVSSRSRGLRAEKMVQKILQSRNHSKHSLCYLLYFLITVIGLLLIIFWFSFDSSIVSLRVRNVSEALQNLYMRCFWTNLANQETRIWAGVRGGIIDQPGFIDIAIETRTTNTTFHKMDQFNNQLWQAVNSLDDDIKLLFSTKNVEIRERNTDNTFTQIAVEDTFQAVTRLLTEGFRNVYKPWLDYPLENYIEKESRFIFDNSHDDLLIVSESLIQVLTENMNDTFANSEAINIGILWTGLVASVMFVMISVGYIFKINRDYFVFAHLLFTFPHEEASQTEMILVAFKDMLDKDYEGIDCIEALEAAQANHQAKAKNVNSPTVKKGTSVNKGSKLANKISIDVLKKKNFFLLLRMLLIIACIIGTLIFYYYWSLQRIKIMEKQQTIINASLDNINLQSMISVELQSLVMDNATSEIRHQPILTALNNDMERLAEISELEKNFRDASGELSDLQLRILRGYNCLEVKSDLYLLAPGSAEEECANLAHGTGILGLVEVITGMKFQLSMFLGDFEVAVRDTDGLKVLYLRVINDFIEYLDVGITMFLMSYSLTLEQFQDLVDELIANGRLLALIGVLISVVGGTWSLFYIIRPLTNKEFDKKVVLSMVPTSMILSNRHVKTYVVRNANLKVREAQYLLR